GTGFSRPEWRLCNCDPRRGRTAPSTGKFFGFGKRAPPAPIDRRPVSRRESHFMEPTNAGHHGGNGRLLILFCSTTTIPWPGRFFRGKAALDRLIPREQAAT